jgi:zinc and cadmium transporter
VSRLVLALALSLLGGFGGLGIAALLVLIDEPRRARIVPGLVSYAVGALLAVALLDLLPQASDVIGVRRTLAAALGGLVGFFVLEKVALWRHAGVDGSGGWSTGPLVLIGDAAHNFMDGALIGASVLVSTSLGVTTALAVLAHEIPHELGDFAILLHAGYPTRRALLFNALSECAGLLGAFVSVVALYRLPTLSPYFLALAAASFIYVVMTDLVPDMHRGIIRVGAVWQVVLLLAGILTVALL